MLKINYVGRLFENTFCVEIHSHSSWEVVYYTKGSGYVEIGNEKIPFEENDIFAIPPNTLHTDYAPNGFRNYHYNLLDFDFNRKSYLKLIDSNNKDFLKVLEQLYYEFHLKRNNWQNIVNSLCDVLNQYILSFSEEFTENEFVEKVINEIIYNFSNPEFDVSKVVDNTHINKDYFRKLFRKYTGKTPLQFLTSKRILFAKQLLVTQKKTNIPMCEIAWRVGFSNYYYFSHVFKKETGISPSSWVEYSKKHNIEPEENQPIPTRYITPKE